MVWFLLEETKHNFFFSGKAVLQPESVPNLRHWQQNCVCFAELRQRQEMLMRNQLMAVNPQLMGPGQQRMQAIPAQFEPRLVDRYWAAFFCSSTAVHHSVRAVSKVLKTFGYCKLNNILCISDFFFPSQRSAPFNWNDGLSWPQTNPHSIPLGTHSPTAPQHAKPVVQPCLPRPR